MTDSIPRLRMFAGPNGSGKTTVKTALQKSKSWFGIYINPDELEAAIQQQGYLSLESLELSVSEEEVKSFFMTSSFLKQTNMLINDSQIACHHNRLMFHSVKFNSYHASVLADYLRKQAIKERRTFTFETVMSSPDKIDVLNEAISNGFRTYLYYIATEDPIINIQRVRNRVADGGHDVPEDKIVSRYHRSLSYLLSAIRLTNRAYFFDTSHDQPWYFAEVSDGSMVDLKTNEIPNWFAPMWKSLQTL